MYIHDIDPATPHVCAHDIDPASPHDIDVYNLENIQCVCVCVGGGGGGGEDLKCISLNKLFSLTSVPVTNKLYN